MTANRAVLAGWSPVQFKGAEGIILIFLRVLLPIRIGHPEGISRFVIFVLDGLEEVVHDPLFSPVAKVISKISQKQNAEDSNYDDLLSPFIATGIVRGRLKESHIGLDTSACR